MKNLILFFCFIFLIASPATAQETCTRHTEPAGKFSYCPPAGWVSKDSDRKYNTFLAPAAENSFRSNLNFTDEATTISNSEFAAAGIKLILSGTMSEDLKAVKVVGWTDFVSTSNIKGSRVVYESFYKGHQVRTIQYILDLPGKKLTFTGTAADASKDATDKIFDAVAKTIKIEP